jgi:hypothetical protein
MVMASPEQEREMRDTIARVRAVIARFHKLRRKNNERAAGMRAAMMTPQQVQMVLRSNRDPQMEQRAVEQLRQFLSVLRGHEPSRQEMQAGIPEGLEEQLPMGGVPFAVAAVAISLGAGVFSVFDYLTTIEEGNQQQTATPLERGLQALSDNIWGVAAVGAVGLGGLVYYRTTKAAEQKREVELERVRVMGKAVGKAMREESEPRKNPEDETLTEKVTGFVKNALFPPEKNPGLSPGEKLAAMVENLSEDEQDRFFATVNGEKIDELEEEEPEENPAPEKNDEEEEGEE